MGNCCKSFKYRYEYVDDAIIQQINEEAKNKKYERSYSKNYYNPSILHNSLSRNNLLLFPSQIKNNNNHTHTHTHNHTQHLINNNQDNMNDYLTFLKL